MDGPQSFGQWLRHRRRELDLTQDALARQVGCARVTIRKLEADDIRPSQQLAELLAEHLGILPAERERFVRFGRGRAPAAPTPAAPRHNLPNLPSSFIGRERDLAAVRQLLAGARLLTLTGPGGMGKTRLAIETARGLLDTPAYPDGAWWVELVGLNDPALVPQAVAKTVDVQEAPNQPMVETLVRALQSRRMLLLLDNCEHLIAACAELAERLLSGCPHLTLLATSREALDILGEMIWPVPALTLPDAQAERAIQSVNQFESVHLFAERATALQPEFELTTETMAVVAQICRRLDGMPLAIELAAARVRMLSVEDIAGWLENRFELLTAGSRTALPRHQTLRAAIDWSYDLLAGPEQALFRRVAIFAGGFTLEAAEAVCNFGDLQRSQVLDLVGRLVDKSLVVADSARGAGPRRYRLLETVREYARQKLEDAGEAGLAQERHLEFYAAFARQADKGLRGTQQVLWFTRAEQEADNLRAAMDRPQAVVPNEAARRAMLRNQFLIVGCLTDFWESGYRHEIVAALKRLLALDDPAEPTTERARALKTGGFVLWSLNRLSEAQAYLQESMAIAEKLGDTLSMAWSLCLLGWAFVSLGQYDSAEMALERSLAIVRPLGEDGLVVVVKALTFLGEVPYWQGNLPKARQRWEEAIASCRATDDVHQVAYPLRRLGYVILRDGDYGHAARLIGESLEANRQVRHRPGMVACLAGFAAIHLAQGNFEKAAVLCGSVESLLQRFGGPFFFADVVEYQRTMAEVTKALDEAALAAAWSKGRALTLEQAIELSHPSAATA